MKLRILQSGSDVILLKDGMLILEGGWDKMLELAQAIIKVSHLAEEWDKILTIAADNAVLIRAGVPIGLTNHPEIKKESIKLAINDRNLRRYMPGGVKSKEVFGTPTIIRGAAK